MKKAILYLLILMTYLSVQGCGDSVYKYPKVRKELIDVVLLDDGTVDQIIISNNKEYTPEQKVKFPQGADNKDAYIRGISQLEFSEDMSTLYRIYNFVQIPVFLPEAIWNADKDPIGKVERCWFTNNRYINLEIKYSSLDPVRHKFMVLGKLNQDFLSTPTLYLELVHQSSEETETVGNYDSLILSIDINNYLEDSSIKNVILSTRLEGAESGPTIVAEFNF